MLRAGHQRVVVGVLIASACLVAVAAAYGLAGRSFRGKTSQRQPISFRISGGYVRKLDYRIADRCRRGLKLINHDHGFTPIRITHGKFGGTFLDRVHHGKAVVSGSLKRGVARGSLQDRTRNSPGHQLCKGKATFSLPAR